MQASAPQALHLRLQRQRAPKATPLAIALAAVAVEILMRFPRTKSGVRGARAAMGGAVGGALLGALVDDARGAVFGAILGGAISSTRTFGRGTATADSSQPGPSERSAKRTREVLGAAAGESPGALYLRAVAHLTPGTDRVQTSRARLAKLKNAATERIFALHDALMLRRDASPVALTIVGIAGNSASGGAIALTSVLGADVDGAIDGAESGFEYGGYACHPVIGAVAGGLIGGAIASAAAAKS
jgi:hypothetical protein